MPCVNGRLAKYVSTSRICALTKYWVRMLFHKLTRLRSALFTLVVGLLLFATAGCGGPKGELCSVHGKVVFAGKPLPDGVIRFTPEKETSGPGGSAAIKDGAYDIKTPGMRSGEYSVSITAESETGRTLPGIDGNPPTKEKAQYIPEDFNRKSKLKETLTAGDNTKNFSL